MVVNINYYLGSNLQALIDAQKQMILPIKIVGVVCNNPNAYAIQRCKDSNIDIFIIERKKSQLRQEFEKSIYNHLQTVYFDFIVCASRRLLIGY